MKRKKVIFTHSWTDVSVNIQTRKVALQLSETYDVIFLTQARIGQSHLHVNDHLQVIEWTNKRPTSYKDFLFAYRLLKKEKPEYVIAHFGGTNVLLIAAWLTGVKHRIAWLHTLTEQTYLDAKTKFRGWLSVFKRKSIYTLATHVVVLNEYGKKNALQEYGIPAKKLVKIYNGINDPGRLNHNISSPKSIRYVGRLDKSKGVDVLIKAFLQLSKKMTDVRLDIVGKGNMRDELEAMVAKEELTERVTICQPITDYSKVFDFICEAWFAVVPSRMDNFPTVVLEYFSTATPVIGSAVGGIPEMLENGNLGLLFKRDDVNALATQMQRLCEDDVLRNELAVKSRKAFEEKYQDNVHVNKVVKFINSLT